MERASGVYKRWMSLLSFAVALAIARTFRQDDILRVEFAGSEAPVMRAKGYSEKPPPLRRPPSQAPRRNYGRSATLLTDAQGAAQT
jgi:predicted acyl esterase